MKMAALEAFGRRLGEKDETTKLTKRTKKSWVSCRFNFVRFVIVVGIVSSRGLASPASMVQRGVQLGGRFLRISIPSNA